MGLRTSESSENDLKGAQSFHLSYPLLSTLNKHSSPRLGQSLRRFETILAIILLLHGSFVMK